MCTCLGNLHLISLLGQLQGSWGLKNPFWNLFCLLASPTQVIYETRATCFDTKAKYSLISDTFISLVSYSRCGLKPMPLAKTQPQLYSLFSRLSIPILQQDKIMDWLLGNAQGARLWRDLAADMPSPARGVCHWLLLWMQWLSNPTAIVLPLSKWTAPINW